MTLTLIFLIIWTPGGLYPEQHYWSSLPCTEVQAMAELRLETGGGGQYELYCEEFNPIHENDLNPWIEFTPENKN